MGVSLLPYLPLAAHASLASVPGTPALGTGEKLPTVALPYHFLEAVLGDKRNVNEGRGKMVIVTPEGFCFVLSHDKAFLLSRQV